MKVLGIDTSGYANAVGVVDGEKVLADATFETKTDSLEQIVDNIDDILQRAGIAFNDVQGIGVGLGPGSWTGIRVGVTVGKILAFSAGKPVVGIPTLEALAYNALDESALACAVIYAGIRDTVYAACYRLDEGMVIRTSDYYVGDVKGLTGMIIEPAVLIGTGAAAYRKILTEDKGTVKANIRAVEAAPRGASIARLAASRLERGEQDDVLSLTPLYLKESTARAFVRRNTSNVKVGD